MIALLTVPYTGTRFFAQILAQHYLRTGLSDDGGGFTALHISDRLLGRIGHVPVIITTWRPLATIRESFHKRGEPAERLEKHHAAWNRLVSEFDCMILTVEPSYGGISREDRLGKLGGLLGVALETDWAPVGNYA